MTKVVENGYEGAVKPFTFKYVNHAGVEGVRNVIPMGFFFGTSKYYTEPQWLMEAWDLDKQAIRHYAFAKLNIPGLTKETLEIAGTPIDKRLGTLGVR